MALPLLAAAMAVALVAPAPAHASAVGWHRLQTKHAVKRTHRAQRAMGARLTPGPGKGLMRWGDAYVVHVRDHWRRRAHRAEHRLAVYRELHPYPQWWLGQALCVHSHEASWHHDGGLGPDVGGGMQIGSSEWAHFGGLAFASRAAYATPAEQLLVAYRYWQVSGWHPWPNTAAMCGLL